MAAHNDHKPSDYRHRDRVPVKRALISVSDKTGLLELASALYASGVAIVSTGSTAKTIAESGIPVTEVSQVTGFPESLDGRVKTLHPKVHGGLLADLRLVAHEKQLEELGIEAFELVVVNLYPFVQTVASGAKGDSVVEQIDIGGPAMVRAAAKNHANVAIVVDPSRYGEVIEAVVDGGTTLAQRRNLAAAAFAHTASYDGAVAKWFADELDSEWRREAGQSEDNLTKNPGFPSRLTIEGDLVNVLRYGENSHQAAALYRSAGESAVADADAEDAIASAHAKAHVCDPVSAFGGVVAANRPVTKAMAEQVNGIFTEVIVAPSYELAALQILTQKKNLRILELPANFSRESFEARQISGGLLLQEPDSFNNLAVANWTLVSGAKADPATYADLEFAWRACRAVKSNGILLAKEGASVGIGMGQVNRVDSCRLAVDRATSRAKGSVAASDAFFPFKDGVEILIEAGVRAIVQPGGSMRDQEVIDAAKAAGITMYFTNERHFYH